MRLSATRELVLICEECEAVWNGGEPVLPETFQSFTDITLARGLSDLWMLELEEP